MRWRLIAWTLTLRLEERKTGETIERKFLRLIYLGFDDDQISIINDLKENANNGDMYAQRSMGSLYFHTRLMKQSHKYGILWYRKAAKQGHPRAQLSLGLRYIKKNKYISKGIDAITSAARLEFPEALYSLGVLYADGEIVENNIHKSMKWTTKAANNGFAKSQTSLGLSHWNGTDGFNENKTEGLKWLTRSALNNEPVAQFALGCIYYMGMEIQKDKKLGLKFINLAADNGLDWAVEFLKNNTLKILRVG